MSGRPEECVSSPERTAAVLAVSPSPAERVRLRKILSQENWRLHEASDCCEALALSRDESVPVFHCERDHADGNWEDLLNNHGEPAGSAESYCVLSSCRRVPLGEGAEAGWFRRADNAFRAAGGLASYLRCLEPLAMRLWREHRQKRRRLRTAQLHPLENVVAPPGRTAGTLT
jgi:hypothetical protein